MAENLNLKSTESNVCLAIEGYSLELCGYYKLVAFVKEATYVPPSVYPKKLLTEVIYLDLKPEDDNTFFYCTRDDDFKGETERPIEIDLSLVKTDKVPLLKSCLTYSGYDAKKGPLFISITNNKRTWKNAPCLHLDFGEDTYSTRYEQDVSLWFPCKDFSLHQAVNHSRSTILCCKTSSNPPKHTPTKLFEDLKKLKEIL